MKRFLKKVLPKRLKLFLIEHRYMFKIKRSNYKRNLTKIVKDNKSELIIYEKIKWVKKLNRLAYSNPDFIKLGFEFASANISILKKISILPNDLVLICVYKNDLVKLKKFISYHRKIGIDKFIILDNDSDDGSIDWLKKQNDVYLLHTKDEYSSLRRVVWINRIIAYIGDNRWYMVLDSDEFLVYNDCENKSIKDVIMYLEKKNIVRARSVMLDMYAKNDYYLCGKIEDFFNECIYFDTDTYYLKDREDFVNIVGGSRERIFNMSPCLTKYPIFYFRKKDVICSSHFLYPYKDNLSRECNFIIRHYKFLPGEIEKYRKIVKKENYYKNSWAYKHYLRVMENKALDFIYKNTDKYVNSSSLNKIYVYKEIEWNDR